MTKAYDCVNFTTRSNTLYSVTNTDNPTICRLNGGTFKNLDIMRDPNKPLQFMQGTRFVAQIAPQQSFNENQQYAGLCVQTSPIKSVYLGKKVIDYAEEKTDNKTLSQEQRKTMADKMLPSFEQKQPAREYEFPYMKL